ncbi:MAG: hypothetical protein AAF743_02965, partial [Planctomycetota bacterium]
MQIEQLEHRTMLSGTNQPSGYDDPAFPMMDDSWTLSRIGDDLYWVSPWIEIDPLTPRDPIPVSSSPVYNAPMQRKPIGIGINGRDNPILPFDPIEPVAPGTTMQTHSGALFSLGGPLKTSESDWGEPAVLKGMVVYGETQTFGTNVSG